MNDWTKAYSTKDAHCYKGIFYKRCPHLQCISLNASVKSFCFRFQSVNGKLEQYINVIEGKDNEISKVTSKASLLKGINVNHNRWNMSKCYPQLFEI